MFVFKRIFNLLRDDERREGVKVAVALFFTTLLDFVSLASLLPVLYWLLKGGENSRAALPFNHIDGPKEEDMFYAFVPFKYVARSYIKYQVTFISCTCRSADVNVWSTAYLELTTPSSGKASSRMTNTLQLVLRLGTEVLIPVMTALPVPTACRIPSSSTITTLSSLLEKVSVLF